MQVFNISLIGPRAVGKTTIGKNLEKKMGWKLINLDKFLDNRLPGGIGGYTKKYGWEKFREQEYSILISMFRTHPKGIILDTGGGTAASEHKFSKHNVHLLKKKSTLILILPTRTKKKNLDVLFKRESKRFFFKDWSNGKLKEKVKADYELRVPKMKKDADLIIYLDSKNPIENIIRKLKLKPPE